MRAGIYDAFDGYQDLHVEALFIEKNPDKLSLLRMSLMHMALRDMITVKDCESMRVLRNQSRDGVLTIAAFISGDPSDGRYSVASRRRAGAIRRREAECAIALFVLFSRSIHRMRSIPHRHVHLLDRRDLAFVQPHQSLQRAAIRSPNVSICASSRSRCQLIVSRPSGLAKVEEGNHIVYGNLV